MADPVPGPQREELLVVCPAGHELGVFAPDDDHGTVRMKCQACRQFVIISNGGMCEVLEHPEDYFHSDRIVAHYDQ